MQRRRGKQCQQCVIRPLIWCLTNLDLYFESFVCTNCKHKYIKGIFLKMWPNRKICENMTLFYDFMTLWLLGPPSNKIGYSALQRMKIWYSSGHCNIVVYRRARQGGGWRPSCIKIGCRTLEPRRVFTSVYLGSECFWQFIKIVLNPVSWFLSLCDNFRHCEIFSEFFFFGFLAHPRPPRIIIPPPDKYSAAA